ncbi:hypothetical protein [Alkaliphilus hydrothermalis]|uniref:CAAX protease self-immunity n=1 Tax=Alkaliphilus hydrothermalis TaxID=1482730 RepID=A0ABS2NPB1_9FIRM|nr:hypothetical protein [Alkaliphilus hydrothermalis]MBM7614780.1 hypothetical protein [Alkaliphilus hydrothermalis]
MFIFSGIIAAAFAYLCNKVILKRFGSNSLVAFVPFIEEFSKSIAAVLMSTHIVGTHFVFGCIEGIYDIVTSSKKIGNLAALASVVSHSFFGLITYITFGKSDSILIAVLVAWVFHSAWNWYITKYL